VRWGQAEKDARYADLDRRAYAAQSIAVPEMMIHGGSDLVTFPESSAGKDQFFVNGYERHVIPDVGHFPTREAPDSVAKLVVQFLSA